MNGYGQHASRGDESEGGDWSSFATTLVSGAGDAAMLGMCKTAFNALTGKTEINKAYYVGAGLAAIYIASRTQKMNPEFFAALWRLTKSPIVFLQKKSERWFCGGESLSWNVLVSWHNRVFDALTPLTKQSSVMDLTKEKRIQALDQAECDVDPVWEHIQQHVYEEFAFMQARFAGHLCYYQDQESQEKRRLVDLVATPVQAAGKACVRLSIKRHEETAFYIKKIMAYCDQLCAYINTVSSKEALDKELIKRIMEDLCSACKHVATLVDDTTAAAPHGAAGKLTLTRTQGSTATSNYANFNTGGDYGSAHY